MSVEFADLGVIDVREKEVHLDRTVLSYGGAEGEIWVFSSEFSVGVDIFSDSAMDFVGALAEGVANVFWQDRMRATRGVEVGARGDVGVLFLRSWLNFELGRVGICISIFVEGWTW